jgi:EmrB/QacA subfamily drug resistance transporter
MTVADDRTRLAPAEEPESQAAGRGWLVPMIIGSSLMMHTLNLTVVFNALPTMATALHEDLLHMNLVVTVFMLATTVFMPVSSWVADRFGARKVFMTAMVMFAVSSAVCGLAQNLVELLAARLVQGAAGAMMIPVGRLVLLRTTPKSELVGAMSVLTMPAMLGPVIGPVIGGAMVTFADWRWIFFMNLPIALVGVLLVRAYVPDVREQEVAPMDWTGVTLTGAGLAALIYGVESLGRSIAAPGAAVALLAAAFVLLALYWAHARSHTNAIIDLSLFRIGTYSASVVAGSFLRIGVSAIPFLLTMLLQVCFGMSAFKAGMMTFVSAGGALLMKSVAPPILRRYGFRTTLLANAAIVWATFMVYALFKPTTPHWLIMVMLGVGGFFRSLQFTSLNGLAYADLEQHQMSRGSATASMVMQLTQSVGIGVSAAMLQVMLQLRHETHLTPGTVTPVFGVFAAVTLLSVPWFLRLSPDAGDEMNNRRAYGQTDAVPGSKRKR